MPWSASLLAKHKRTRGGAQMAMLVDHEMVLLMLCHFECLGED
jgi:hypothetical protein